MSDAKPPRHTGFFDFEPDRAKAELTRPQTLLRTTEWGLLTITSLLAAWAFPPYFIQVLWLAFFNAGGLLWVTHLSESGRQRLRVFEERFAGGHALEEEGRPARAVAYYLSLQPEFKDEPQLLRIIESRVNWLQGQYPAAFAVVAKPKRTKSARRPRPK